MKIRLKICWNSPRLTFSKDYAEGGGVNSTASPHPAAYP